MASEMMGNMQNDEWRFTLNHRDPYFWPLDQCTEFRGLEVDSGGDSVENILNQRTFGICNTQSILG